MGSATIWADTEAIISIKCLNRIALCFPVTVDPHTPRVNLSPEQASAVGWTIPDELIVPLIVDRFQDDESRFESPECKSHQWC